LAKTFYSKQEFNASHQSAYCHGIASGMLVEHNHNPLLAPLLRRLVQITKPNDAWFQKWKSKQNDFRIEGECPEVMNQATYDFILARYSITRSECDELADYYSKITDFRVQLDHPVIDKIIAVDLATSLYDQNQTGLDSHWRVRPLSEKELLPLVRPHFNTQ